VLPTNCPASSGVISTCPGSRFELDHERSAHETILEIGCRKRTGNTGAHPVAVQIRPSPAYCSDSRERLIKIVSNAQQFIGSIGIVSASLMLNRAYTDTGAASSAMAITTTCLRAAFVNFP
jgi:hypothetical protein